MYHPSYENSCKVFAKLYGMQHMSFKTLMGYLPDKRLAGPMQIGQLGYDIEDSCSKETFLIYYYNGF